LRLRSRINWSSLCNSKVAKLNQDIGGEATKDNIVVSLQQQLGNLQQLIGEDAAKNKTIKFWQNRLKAATLRKVLFEEQEKEMVALQQKVRLAWWCLRFLSLMTLSLLSIRWTSTRIWAAWSDPKTRPSSSNAWA
jgi:hypothetical protein